jgi:long-chain fatty acid transport protein
MQRRSGRSRLAPALAALPLALVAAMAGQRAQAAGFQLQENDAEGMGRAYAGAGAAPGDCAVVENNPAAMSEFTMSCLQGDLTAINFGTHFHGSGTDILGEPLTGGNGGDGGTTLPVPASTTSVRSTTSSHSVSHWTCHSVSRPNMTIAGWAATRHRRPSCNRRR